MFVDGLQCHFQNEAVTIHKRIKAASGVVKLAGIGMDCVVMKVPSLVELPFSLTRMCFVLMDGGVVSGRGLPHKTIVVVPIVGFLGAV